jgi:hypothetical protein
MSRAKKDVTSEYRAIAKSYLLFIDSNVVAAAVELVDRWPRSRVV